MQKPSLQTKDIIKYLKKNIESLDDSYWGSGYRASVCLTDGTYLPCVIFRNPSMIVNLAIKRFREEKFKYNIVRSFVTGGNRINSYDIAKVEKSPYAFPLSIQHQIKGETTMGWTGFAAKMKDGTYWGFGTSFSTEFFDMPTGYSPDDISEIINHSYVLDTGELKSHKLPNNEIKVFTADDYGKAIVYREKPFFECFLDDL